ncbi:glutamine--tRNA ligase [Ferrovum sp. JA12]|uniref:glutamine--tRNA ligase/YqeY domain fusion protein n=1 Tax=Ferrovum sp. JA12 TaxID=1356299 RepID=UPI00070251C1|nr:glutamine--tRNA ligase/YqeY domain fusion protein [Ferrovum sp. JA12]KRH79304.1 glutamine--tRNA ligase [Ferrovum sp. JA12]
MAANFIRQIIEEDLKHNQTSGRVATRFPPEPNGYLHIGHAKSICLNFGLARDFEGQCHLRFDDTNPTKEDTEYVDSIIDTVRWLGFDWGSHLYYASDYFERCYAIAESLINRELAYVDSLSAEHIREYRGTLTSPGKNSPFRERSIADNLTLFRAMRAGTYQDGEHVLRLKIDMASPNMNLRDPIIYRIRHAAHWRTGNAWCIYPMYDYAHAISDALESITHSICTLEFEDHRPLYDWVIQHADIPSEPHQYEFSRLNLTFTMMSKRKLLDLVNQGHVSGWDDPRMPTLAGLKRRGYSPGSIRTFCERIGVSKAESLIDVTVLEDCLREDLNLNAPRRVAVLHPVKLIIDNYPEGMSEVCLAPNHPHYPEWGKRELLFTRELVIERDDFMQQPVKGFFRLTPGSEVRLRYAYVIRCTGFDVDPHTGELLTIHAEYLPETKSGTPGADTVKVKGNIHWLSPSQALKAEIRLFDRLFKDPNPGVLENYEQALNPDSLIVLKDSLVEPQLFNTQAGQSFQFERLGYFCLDEVDSQPHSPIFNRAVSLRDTWNNPKGK